MEFLSDFPRTNFRVNLFVNLFTPYETEILDQEIYKVCIFFKLEGFMLTFTNTLAIVSTRSLCTYLEI